MRKSCDYCVRMKRACDGKTPCQLCTRRNKKCTRSAKKKSGPAKGSKYATRRKRDMEEAGMSPCLLESSSVKLVGAGQLQDPQRDLAMGGGTYLRGLDHLGHEERHQ
ncbi:unnamed protein product, partial [Choristocarpus tenellus]